jgi:hypothetical protein
MHYMLDSNKLLPQMTGVFTFSVDQKQFRCFVVDQSRQVRSRVITASNVAPFLKYSFINKRTVDCKKMRNVDQWKKSQ